MAQEKSFVEITGEEIFKIRCIDLGAEPRIGKEGYEYRVFVYQGRAFQMPEEVAQLYLNGELRSLRLEESTFEREIVDPVTGELSGETVLVKSWAYDGHVTWKQYTNLVKNETEISKIKLTAHPQFLNYLATLKNEEAMVGETD